MFRFLSVVLLLLLVGCGSSKKVSPSLSLGVAAVTAVATDSIVLIKSDSLAKDNLDSLPAALTKEQVLLNQKASGINKNVDWAPAIHYDWRKPTFVIIHHTSQNSTAQTVRTFQLEHTKVSAHYVIGRDGQVIQMLNDYDRGWHAGKSKWGQITDMNSVSLGIELDNNGREAFPKVQIDALITLLDILKSKYSIPQLNFIGHADIAPTRKNDPNVLFPWKLLADKGFGIWYNETYMVEPSAQFNPIDALKIMGYDMSVPKATIEAFKRKYIVKEVNGVLTNYDIKVLYDLYKRYY